eukprot:TRINITY_DN12404_c0_g1_i1.p1 TRINITY_DN12404_c0_g1~~TRINITY_DN12404_c0_g1_i1.p1  ORF type:complete len:294 (-),score=58.62 TRINITY_DN12404_c0_g1_i1:82-963(-)
MIKQRISLIAVIITILFISNIKSTSPFENFECSPCPNPPDMEELTNKFPESVTKYYIETTRFRHTLDKSFVPFCDKKYPDPKSLDFIDKLRNSKIKLLFSVVMHNDEKIFAHWYHNFMMFLSWFPHQNLYVSLREYNSKDRTPIWLNLMSKVLEARGIAHEFHLDNSIKMLNKNVMLQSSISPIHSRDFDEVIFMEASAFCSVDLAKFIHQSLHHPVSLSPIKSTKMSGENGFLKDEEECHGMNGKYVFSIDPDILRNSFNFENGFCSILRSHKVIKINDVNFCDSVETLEKN